MVKSDFGELVVFSWPCDVHVGNTVQNRLSVLDGSVQSAYLSDWPDELKAELGVERIERIGPYSYRGVGRVIDQSSGFVEVRGFVLDFGEVPCDGHVEFECERLDLPKP